MEGVEGDLGGEGQLVEQQAQTRAEDEVVALVASLWRHTYSPFNKSASSTHQVEFSEAGYGPRRGS